MRNNLNPLFENFLDHNGPKIRINQDFYLTSFLNRYKSECLNIINDSETIQEAYFPFKELTALTLFDLESCAAKAAHDGIITYNIFKIKKNAIIENMNLMNRLVDENDPNWKIKLKTSILISAIVSKYI